MPIVIALAIKSFQSAPANYGGRIKRFNGEKLNKEMFQSAPANYGGRIKQATDVNPDFPRVSIRARQLRRANRVLSVRIITYRRNVSIRARQLRRANLCYRYAQLRTGMFQSAPANYGGRIAIQRR